MANAEMEALKEDLRCMARKCEELNKELCYQVDMNKELRTALEDAERRADNLDRKNEYLRGKVDAFEFMISNKGN